MTPAPQLGLATQPDTVHDFGGFAPALYRLSCPAAGHPELAQRALDLLAAAGWNPRTDALRGLDHGAWVPLMHLYPEADVPVFQLSLPARIDAEGAWALGRALAPLAHEGVLIVGSDSLTHNLYEFRGHPVADAAYAAEFAGWVRQAVEQGDGERLRRTLQDAPHAQRAHPTPEHFWPLLVAAGAAHTLAAAQVVEGGIAHGVLSMDSFVFCGMTEVA